MALQTDSPTNRIGVLIVVCVAMLFGVLNTSAIVVVPPDIAADLDVNISELSWVMTGFLLVYGVAIPFYGRLADLHGARPLFIFGVGVFAVGSLLAALASDFPLLLGARLIQSAGGAAVPGLGMAMAIRAYGPESRGIVLGVIGATIGFGGGIGPLLGGVLADAWGWESIFLATSATALIIPTALVALPREEETVPGRLDVLGGVLLGVAVVGVLLASTEGASAGWTSTWPIAGIVMAVVSLALLALNQRTSASPFIPNEFLNNQKLIAFVSMSFLVMAATVGPLIGIPVMLAAFNGSAAIDIGLIMLPAAIFTALSGVFAGKLVDRLGARLLARTGGLLMLVAVIGLSSFSGDEAWLIAASGGVLGGGFGLVNTPLATSVSRVVQPQVLASALGINSMLFFIGGSIGAAALLGFSATDVQSSLNPVHEGVGAGFSDGFLFLALPVLAVLYLSSRLPVAVPQELEAEATPTYLWRPDCSIPWVSECEESLWEKAEGA